MCTLSHGCAAKTMAVARPKKGVYIVVNSDCDYRCWLERAGQRRETGVSRHESQGEATGVGG